MIAIVENYFKAWNAFDLDALGDLMQSDITLRDWLSEVHGRDNVLKANAGIFEQFPKVKIDVISIATAQEAKAMAQLKILLTTAETLDVVDVFEFSSSKIQSITAYKV